jgi:Peptidase propeptide and YPEB domain
MKVSTVALGIAFAVVAAVPAQADRDPTAAEEARISEFLRSEGFRDWEYIELDDEAWEVEGAMPEGSDEGYDLKLDTTTLEIIERTED